MAGVKGQRSGGANRRSREFHILHGTFKKSRHGAWSGGPPPVEPPAELKPRKPLTGEAKAEWKRMSKDLQTAGVASEQDAARLYMYAKLFAETEAIESDAVTNRLVMTNAKRALKDLEGTELAGMLDTISTCLDRADRFTIRLRQNRMSIRQYLNDFGMTPVARHGKMPMGRTKSRLEQFQDQA